MFNEEKKKKLQEIMLVDQSHMQFIEQGKMYEMKLTIDIEKFKKKIEGSIRNTMLEKNELNFKDYLVFNCNTAQNVPPSTHAQIRVYRKSTSLSRETYPKNVLH